MVCGDAICYLSYVLKLKLQFSVKCHFHGVKTVFSFFIHLCKYLERIPRYAICYVSTQNAI